MRWSRHYLGAMLIAFAMPAMAQPAADHHQHFFGPETIARAPTLRLVDAPKLIELLDAAGIQRAVVLSTAYQLGNPNRPVEGDEYAQVRAENDWTSRQVALYPTRLIGFCGFNPLKSYALAELERCAKDPHMRRGIKLHIGNSVVEMDKREHVEQLQKVFRAANVHRMAIVVHLRASISQKKPYGAKQAQIFLNEVVSQAPRSVVQIAHLADAGGYQDPLADEAMQVFIDAIRRNDPRAANLYFDISGVTLRDWKEAGRSALIARRIREVGVKRVLFGSDGANAGNPDPKEAWERFRQLPLTAEELAAIEKNVAPYFR